MSDILDNKIIGLEGLAFETEIDKNVFIEWLDKHDHIKPNFINRNDLDNKSFILEGNENGEYELKIAIDIKNIELYNLSVYLEKELGLEYFGSIKRFQNKVKILTSTLIKSGSLTLEETKEILSENNIEIDDNIFETSTNFTFSEIKEIIFQINQMSGENILENGDYKKLTKKEIKSVASKMLQQLLFTQAHNRGVDELGGIKTMTQGEVRDLYNRYGLDNKEINLEKFRVIKIPINKNIYKNLKLLDNGKLKLNGYNELFEGLNINEGLLSEKIGIVELKSNLLKVRKKGSKEEIEILEVEYTNKIIKVLYENYPWNNLNGYGAFSKQIKEEKELYCVGFSLVGHKFLQELGIKHSGIAMPNHSGLEINIGEKKYYFDVTASNRIHEFKYGNDKNGVFKEILLKRGNFTKRTYGYSGDVNDILKAQIYNNLGSEFDDYELRVKFYKKSILLDNKNYLPYMNLGGILFENGDIKGSLKSYEKSLKLFNESSTLYQYMAAALYYNSEKEKSIDYFKKSLNIDITDYSMNTLGKVFNIMGKEKLSKLSFFIYNNLKKGKKINISLVKRKGYYTLEEIKILEFIKNKNFKKLKNYYFKELNKEGF